jgi:hypothetical protein
LQVYCCQQNGEVKRWYNNTNRMRRTNFEVTNNALSLGKKAVMLAEDE